MQSDLPTFIQALLNQDLYPHPVEKFEVIQTHLSWVILTGPYAYKIKKPLSFGFQDFTTVEKRKYYCALELMLNQRYTKNLYESVLSITGTSEAPIFSEEGEAIDYAIRMRQFPQEALLSNVLKAGKLSPTIMRELAAQTADFHLSTERCPDEAIYGSPEQAYAPAEDNFKIIRPHLTEESDLSTLDCVEKHAKAAYLKIQDVLAKRKAAGFTRACHGDMHLSNAVILEGKATFFDCIEFNESFRWTDVMADVAFITMDCDAFERPDLANLFLNIYLEITGDYGGLEVLAFYQAYRAMVRAKIAILQSTQASSEAARADFFTTFRKYTALAASYMQPRPLSLAITFGLSGSGKSTYAAKQMQLLNAIRLRSDVERKRLAGLPVHQPSPLESRGELYSEEMTEKTFAQGGLLIDQLLSAGWPVIIDAACLLYRQRKAFRDLADKHGCSFEIWHLEVPDEILSERLASRAPEASDATIEVVHLQQVIQEPLRKDERDFVRHIETFNKDLIN